jgi:hypothetical protein
LIVGHKSEHSSFLKGGKEFLGLLQSKAEVFELGEDTKLGSLLEEA